MRGAYRRAFREGMPKALIAVLMILPLALWVLMTVGMAAPSPTGQADASQPSTSVDDPKVNPENVAVVESRPLGSVQENKFADTVSRIEAEDGSDGTSIRVFGNGRFVDYKVRKIGNDHLVLEIKNASHPARRALVPTTSKQIKKLWLDGSKDTSTVIHAELAGPVGEYRVDHADNGLVLNVHGRNLATKPRIVPTNETPEINSATPTAARDDSVRILASEIPAPTSMPARVEAISTNAVPPVILTAAPAGPSPASSPTVPPVSAKKATGKAGDPTLIMTKVYTGKPISLDLQEADVKNVLRLLADVSGANIVIEPDVGGKVSLKVNKVPWDQVLDMILAMNNLGQDQSGGVIRIARQDKLKKELNEREAEFKARQQVIETAKEMGDIATNYLQVNYAQAAKIATKIDKMKSPKGKVTVDDRTNLILYSDYPAFIQSARELLAKLDLPTPQVLIEGRIVQLNANASRELGIQWNFSSTATDSTGFHQYLGNLAINHAVAATSAMGFGFGQILGQTLYNIDIQIQAAESAGKGKIVSAPRVLTLDNVEATIVQGTQIPYRKLSEFGVTTTEFKDATLELKVTPHITPDQKVRLEIKAKKEQPDFTQLVGSDAAPAIQTRRVTTELLVADGDTVVIGGVIEDTESLNESRTPGLSQVPILGALFKNQRYQKQKNELLIFISPRIASTAIPVRANRERYVPGMGATGPGRM
ncbi:MAG TPA: hypothetical protein DCZ69_01070 [Syntrophobacteraceae bacterium]|nr:hypothetical protein [Syntrophobacteraceae bacterium]